MKKIGHYDGDHAMECVNHKTVETRLSFTTSSLPLTFVTLILSESLGNFVLSEARDFRLIREPRDEARLHAELLSHE